MTRRLSSPRPFLWMLALPFGVPAAAAADSGAPFVARNTTELLIILVVIVLVEAWVYRLSLRIRFVRLLAVSAVANLLSTMAGILFAELVLANVLARLTNQSPFLLRVGDARYLRVSALSNVAPAGWLVILGVMFLLTVLVESVVARRMLRALPQPRVQAAVWRVNLVTYGLLALLRLCHLGFSPLIATWTT